MRIVLCIKRQFSNKLLNIEEAACTAAFFFYEWLRMKLKVYAYKNCDTCRKAKKYLDKKGLKYELIPVREQPPTKVELRTMLANYDGNIRKLFNTSGGDYKALNLKEKLANMTDEQAVKLLSVNGNLVKRPFAVAGNRGIVGFKEEEWGKWLD